MQPIERRLKRPLFVKSIPNFAEVRGIPLFPGCSSAAVRSSNITAAIILRYSVSTTGSSRGNDRSLLIEARHSSPRPFDINHLGLNGKNGAPMRSITDGTTCSAKGNLHAREVCPVQPPSGTSVYGLQVPEALKVADPSASQAWPPAKLVP